MFIMTLEDVEESKEDLIDCGYSQEDAEIIYQCWKEYAKDCMKEGVNELYLRKCRRYYGKIIDMIDSKYY